MARNLDASPSAVATTSFLYASASCNIFSASPRALGITSLAYASASFFDLSLSALAACTSLKASITWLGGSAFEFELA